MSEVALIVISAVFLLFVCGIQCGGMRNGDPASDDSEPYVAPLLPLGTHLSTRDTEFAISISSRNKHSGTVN